MEKVRGPAFKENGTVKSKQLIVPHLHRWAGVLGTDRERRKSVEGGGDARRLWLRLLQQWGHQILCYLFWVSVSLPAVCICSIWSYSPKPLAWLSSTWLNSISLIATGWWVRDLWPTVLQAVSEEAGHRSVRWRLHCCTAGCSACCQSGGLVRLTRPQRRLVHVRAADSWLALQVLRQDRLRVHLPNDRSAAGWKSSGHPGVQTRAGDPWPRLRRLLMETGMQGAEVSSTGPERLTRPGWGLHICGSSLGPVKGSVWSRMLTKHSYTHSSRNTWWGN